MKSWKKPTSELIDKALGSFKKEHHRKYFFSRLENPLWLKPLAERGCFKHPPKAQRFDDGTVQFPYWPEIRYLKNVCTDLPNEIIDLVVNLPKVDNPVVYDGILDIALQLLGKQSAKLKDKLLEYVRMDHQLSPHKYADLLAHWISENQISAALEISKVLVAFAPDPQSEEKQKRRKADPMSWGTLLHPSPRFDFWNYREIMLKGIRPLAEKEPYKVACLLIDATVNMFRLRMHQDNLNKEQDFSDIWFARLHGLDKDYNNPDKALVHTLTFACEMVFEKLHDAIVGLDKLLRNQQWKIFKRLRQHLYAQYPNEKTKPWVRELILEHKNYHQAQHSYEFQQMIRSSCDHFKEKLLTKEERVCIFNAILSGPSKEDFRKGLAEEFTEERFQKHQHYFHRQQFMPFESVLFGEYKTYFQRLEDKADDPISDEDYPPFKAKSGWVTNHRPRPPEDLANLTDEELLTFINEWEKEDELIDRETFERINIEALANVFQKVFRESIIPVANRLKFWMDNRERMRDLFTYV